MEMVGIFGRGRIAAAAGWLVGDTLVATADGWRRADALAPGMRVDTFDGGLKPVRSVARRLLPAGTELVHVPGGMLSACSDLLLLPEQPVLVPTGPAEPVLGEAYAFVPAAALAGRSGAGRLRPGTPLPAVAVGMDAEEAVWANTGVLLRCGGPAADGFYPLLALREAAAMLALAEPVAGRGRLATLLGAGRGRRAVRAA